MKINQLKAGSILSYVQMALNILIGLVYMPIMIQQLGASEHGLYSTITSTISVLSLLSLGFNSSYVRYFAKYKKNNDTESIYKLNGLFMILFLIIGAVALACGLFLTGNLELVFAEGLTPDEYEIARVLMLLLTINLTVSFPASVFSSIISANERFVVLKLLGMVRTVISPLVTIPLLLLGFRSIAMVTVTVVLSLIVDVAYMVYVFAVLKNKFLFHGFEKGIVRDLFVYTSFIALNMVVDQVNWNVDKILLGRYQGTAAASIYGVGFTLYNYYMMFSTSVSGVFAPRVHKLVQQTQDNPCEQRRQLTEFVTRVGRLQFLILSLVATGLLFFGQYFIGDLWAKPKFDETLGTMVVYDDSYWIVMMLVAASTIPLVQNVCIEIQRAQNKHRFRSLIYAGIAVLNFIASFFLVQTHGAIGCAFATMVSMLIGNGLIMNIYYHKKCNIDVWVFWKEIVSCAKGLILPLAAGFGLSLLVNSVWSFLLCIAGYAIVFAVSMWLFGMNAYEKQLVSKPLQSVKSKLLKKHR